MNKDSVTMQVLVWTYIFISFEQISSNVDARLYDKCTFKFIRNCQTDIKSDYPFSFLSRMHELFFASNPCQNLALSAILSLAIPTDL